MKIFVDTDVLIDLADPNPNNVELADIVNNVTDFSFWISAASIPCIINKYSDLLGSDKTQDYLNYIQEKFSIIPLRHSILTGAFKKNDTDFEVQVQIASAEEFHMDYIITRNVDHFKKSRVAAITPIEFLEKWNAGEFNLVSFVPFLDLKAQQHQIYNEIDDRITDIITNTGFILGKHVDEFEESFAELQEAKYCIGVSSGTDALHIAMMALGIGPGDAVIVPVNTFIATAEAVSLCGAVPVFADCDEYYNLDTRKLEEFLRKSIQAEISHRPTPVRSSGPTGRTQTHTDLLSDRPDRTKTFIASREESAQKTEMGELQLNSSSKFNGVNIGQGERSKDQGVRIKDYNHPNHLNVHNDLNYSRITGIIPVHLYGQPVNMDKIMALADEYNLMVVEDCCQAHLAKWKDKSVGNFGAFGAFSFYPGKNLGAYGEAGALITNNKNLYLKAKMIRQHGEIERYNHKVIGHNYRLEAIQGAVLSTKLKYLEEWTKKRKKNAQLYTEILSEVDGIQTPKELDGTSCVYHLFVIQTENRDGLQDYLQQNGISTGLHYPIPLHLQEAYKDLGYKQGDFSVAERSSGRILSLPMYPELTEKQIRYVCEKIKEYIHHRGTEGTENKIF